MPLYIDQSGDLDRCYLCLTDSQTLKDRATELLKKYKSGALVTQFIKTERRKDKDKKTKVPKDNIQKDKMTKRR